MRRCSTSSARERARFAAAKGGRGGEILRAREKFGGENGENLRVMAAGAKSFMKKKIAPEAKMHF